MDRTDWTAGYVAELGYTFGYYAELNPLRARLALTYAGFAAPEIRHACELGFGQGLSVNIHAAASDAEWFGTDFNPSQAAFAQDLAAASGSGAKLYDDAFGEFCTRTDLPEFEFIGLHGIWSWISDSNREVLVDFVRSKLAVGGILYVSYNTLPGWGAFAPMRHLLTRHTEVIGASGTGLVDRIDAALDFADRLMAVNPGFARANPQIAERLKQVRGQNRQYLAHEYFNRDWDPMHFSTFAEWLAPAKVSYACSAHFLDHLDPVNLTTEQRELLASIPDPVFQQAVRDFIGNQQFRRDLWIKGPRRLSTLEQVERLRGERVLLISESDTINLTVNGWRGEATLNEGVYKAVVHALAAHQVKTIGDIEIEVRAKGLTLPQVTEAIIVLLSQGAVVSAQDPAVSQRAKGASDRLNAKLMGLSRANTEISHLASPVSGGGVPLGRFGQLMLLARSVAPKKPPEHWVEQAWKTLQAQGQRIVKDGKVLEKDEENLAELTAEAELVRKRLPVLTALGLA